VRLLDLRVTRSYLSLVQEGKPLGTPKKNSFDLQSIGGPVWGWIISIIKKFLPVLSTSCPVRGLLV